MLMKHKVVFFGDNRYWNTLRASIVLSKEVSTKQVLCAFMFSPILAFVEQLNTANYGSLLLTSSCSKTQDDICQSRMRPPPDLLVG